MRWYETGDGLWKPSTDYNRCDGTGNLWITLPPYQNQQTRDDRKHGQAHCRCGIESDIKYREESGENQPKTKQDHSDVSACETTCHPISSSESLKNLLGVYFR